jgi:DNA-binding transcriptional MerR regulator
MKNAQKKELARGLYINSSLNQTEIATQVGTTPKTLRTWINEGGWSEIKQSKTLTRPHLLQQAYLRLQENNKALEILKPGEMASYKTLMDAKAIIGKEIERLSDSPLHQYIEVCEDLMGWVAAHLPDQLQSVTAMLREFIEDVHKRQR